MPRRTATFDEVECIKETPAAILVTGGELGDDEIWVPKSVVDDDSDVYREGDEGALVVHEWWAEKEGLA